MSTLISDILLRRRRNDTRSSSPSTERSSLRRTGPRLPTRHSALQDARPGLTICSSTLCASHSKAVGDDDPGGGDDGVEKGGEAVARTCVCIAHRRLAARCGSLPPSAEPTTPRTRSSGNSRTLWLSTGEAQSFLLSTVGFP